MGPVDSGAAGAAAAAGAEEEEEPPVEKGILKVQVEKRPGQIHSFTSGVKFRTPSVKINRSLFSKSKSAIVANRLLQC